MWSRIVGGLAVLLGASYLIQMLVPKTRSRNKSTPRRYLMWDVAPFVGFLGVLLLALSLIEAIRREAVVAWAGGGALGLVVGLSMWFALAYTWSNPVAPFVGGPAPKKKPFLFGILHHIRTFGPPLLIVLLVLNVAIRIVGAMLEVFLAGAAGVFILALAVVLFAGASRLDSQ